MRTSTTLLPKNATNVHLQQRLLSKKALQALLDSSLDVICAIDGDGRFRHVSAACSHVWGYAPAELAGKRFIDLVAAEDREKTALIADAVMEGAALTAFENRYVRKDGTLVPVLWSARWCDDEQILYAVGRDATQIKRLEEQKRLQECRQRRAYKLAGLCWWEYDIASQTFTAADELFALYGVPARDQNQTSLENFLALVHPEDQQRVLHDLFTLSQERYFNYEHRIVTPCGETVYLRHYSEVVRDENGEPVALHGAAKNITDEKGKEHALRVANERYELVNKATSDAVWDWDIQTNTCFFSETYTALFGHENSHDLIYNNWADHIYPDDKLDVITSVDTALNDSGALQWEGQYRFLRKDGSIAHVLDRAFVIRDETGKALRMVGAMQDITEKVKTEVELTTLSLIAKETANAILITDADERIQWVNKSFTTSTGYTLDEVIGRRPGEFLQGAETSRRAKAYLHKCVEQRRPFHCEILNYTKTGEEYWIELFGQPIFDGKGNLTHFFAIQNDITERKNAEALIRSSEEKYKRLFYNSPLPKWNCKADSLQISDVNDAACTLYGYTREEFLRLRVNDLRLADDLEELHSATRALAESQGIYTKMVKHRKKNGTTFLVRISSFTLRLQDGLHFITTAIDMTEQLALHKKLVKQRLAAQKQVSRAILQTQEYERSEIGKELHDNVCQLLTTAKLYVESTRYMPEQREEFAKKSVDLLLQSIGEIRGLSHQLVSPVVRDLPFEAVLDELVHHYERLRLFKVQVRCEIQGQHLDKGLQLCIYRILQEQFNNTVKYAKASQVQLTITVSEEELVVTYQDDGLGFDPAKVKSGLGLRSMQHRASMFKGQMTLMSSPGKGCSIQVVFPNPVPGKAKASCARQKL